MIFFLMSMCCFIISLPSHPTFDSGLHISIILMFTFLKTFLLFHFHLFLLLLYNTYIKVHGSQCVTQWGFGASPPPPIPHRCANQHHGHRQSPPPLLSKVIPFLTSHIIDYFCWLLNSFCFKCVCLLVAN